MPSTKSVVMAAAIALYSTVSAHMIMATPKPFEFADTSLANGPLNPTTGADFPCKSGNAKFNRQGVTSMAQGSSQKLSFTGGATHGGGSCQVSLSADLVPTKNSVFKVIHSIEGGCPARKADGNIGGDASAADPDSYQFTIPKDLAAGDYTLAWTWFNNVGNQEMYMNCAPITVTGGSGGSGNGTVKRDEGSLIGGPLLAERAAGSLSSLSSAPNMFVANIGNGCKRPRAGGNIKFPDPGPSVEIKSGASFTPPEGTTCGGSTGSSAGGSASGLSSSAPSSTATSVAPPPSNTGGVFAPSAASAAPSTASPAPSVASAAPSSPPVVVPSAPSAPVNGTTGGSGGALTGSCATEGSFNCVGGSSFQQCASGVWSVVQQMASGTTCTPGQTQTLTVTAGKRSLRFRRGHGHRRHNSYLDAY
jgi:hypothetical protein